MVATFHICEVCGRRHETFNAAIRCEVSFHGLIDIDPLERDTFYTIGEVSKRTGIKTSRISMWMKRHGRIFVHMLDTKSQTDFEWCNANGRAALLQARGSTRYLIPSRDIGAMCKALRLFNDPAHRGQGFDTGSLGPIVVHSETGGAFRVPVK